MLKAIKQPKIPVSDKPLKLGGNVQYLKPAEFQNFVGIQYEERVDYCSAEIDLTNFQESIAGRLTSADLKLQLDNIIQKPRDYLAVCKINDSVGHGVFAMKSIPKDTVLCFYAGTVMSGNKSTKFDEAIGFYGTDAAISTQNYRGIASFFQHLPSEPPVKDISLLQALFRLSCQEVSEKVLMLEEELLSIDFFDGESNNNLALANIRQEFIIYRDIPVVLLVTNQPVEAGDQLGFKYGHYYWSSRGMVPELFDKSGAVIPRDKYCRKFGILQFDDFVYSGDLRPLLQQVKKRVKFVQFTDDNNVPRSLQSSLVAAELIKVNALSSERYSMLQNSSSIANSSATYFSLPSINQLMKKYKLADDSQKSYAKGLRNAATNGFEDDLKVFIGLVEDINATDDNQDSKRTALIHAARKGHLACYDLLIKNGANPEIVDASGKCAKDYLNVASNANKLI